MAEGEKPRLDLSRVEPGGLRLELSGDWILGNDLPGVDPIEDFLEEHAGITGLGFDASHLKSWDHGLLVFLKQAHDLCLRGQIRLDTEGLPPGPRGLLELATAVPEKETREDPLETSILTRIGDVTLRVGQSWSETLSFIGEAALSFFRLLRGRARMRRIDLLAQMQECGANALPIVTLITFLVGVILAFTGAIPLRMFGAEIYVSTLVGVALVREMGPMMTAIILAGRSGAAFAAELGTMTVNEEIDALKTMGFSPMDFLVLPRMLALGLMMPLLALYADFMGILGGALTAKGMMGISFSLYFQDTIAALPPLQFFLGLIKAFIYGVLVALAGCMRGMQCGRSASAVGAAATSAVVTGIMYIIVASAVTTFIFSVLGY
jgi:phospholipid/cholesterol/gamma-HCH transport system permease protein